MIIVTIKVNEQQEQRLKKAAKSNTIHFADRNKLTKEILSEAEVIIGNIPISRLKDCRNLKWIQLNNAGADDFASSRDLKPETILTNSTGAYGPVIAEHMLGMLFLLQKHLISYYLHQRQREWVAQGPPMVLEGKTVVLIGTGDIGSAFAGKVKALGCYTIGIKRRKAGQLAVFDELYTNEELENILPRADILAMSLPQTRDTVSFLDQKRMALLKPSAIVINVGRGSAIDTDSLVEALKYKRIAGAALDVTDPEPLPPEHPLWTMEQVIITPHIAGNYNVPETLDRIVDIAEDNLRRYLENRPMRNVVDRDTGYCK